MIDVTKSLRDTVARMPNRDCLPPVNECGLGHSPRRSSEDTAVVLSPDDYGALLAVRDLWLQGEAAIAGLKERVAQFDAFCEAIIGAIGHADEKNPLAEVVMDKIVELNRLKAAIVEHHAQKADDRCFMDDDRLYVAAGLPKADIHVGDKAAMLANCERFIQRRCMGGEWLSYVELETALHAAKAHPEYSYIVCPVGEFDSYASEGTWERCREAETPGNDDQCWRRRRAR